MSNSDRMFSAAHSFIRGAWRGPGQMPNQTLSELDGAHVAWILAAIWFAWWLTFPTNACRVHFEQCVGPAREVTQIDVVKSRGRVAS